MTNLFRNPLFNQTDSSGSAVYHPNNIPEIALPISWDAHWYTQVRANDAIAGVSDTFPLPKQDQPFFAPEIVNWNRADIPANEVSLFANDGVVQYPFVLKGFHGYAPVWFAFGQVVSGLVVGQRYKMSFDIFPDLVSAMSGSQKVWAGDPISGNFRLWYGTSTTDWLDGTGVAFGSWHTMSYEFTCTATTMYAGFETRLRHGLLTNGVFLRNPQLVATGTPAPVPAPTPLPNGTDTPLPATNVEIGVALLALQAAQGYLDMASRSIAILSQRLK